MDGGREGGSVCVRQAEMEGERERSYAAQDPGCHANA
jgi:hypothetical protein